jgi:anti-anti-sigma regulatory factor
MDFYFKPQPGGFKDNILRVQPDILPPGSVKIEAVWINGERYADFDAEALTINLPVTEEAPAPHTLQYRPAWAGNPRQIPPTEKQELRVRVRIAPAGLPYDMKLSMQGNSAELLLEGNLDEGAVLAFKQELDRVVAAKPKRLVLLAEDLTSLSKECGRVLVFFQNKIGIDTDIYVVAANDEVRSVLSDLELLDDVTLVGSTDEIPSQS